MMSKGKWIKTNNSQCYHGKVPTFYEYVTLLRTLWNKDTRRKLNPDDDSVQLRYEILLEDLKKSRFRDYKKSSYDFLMKTGLQKRQKKLTPRNKK